MSRIARKNYNTSFFHVMVQGIEKRYIFDTEKYIKKYIYLIKKYEKEINIKILSYCIMNNHAHLLIYTESISKMSKFMQKVNSEYAKYYNYKENGRVGYVYRDRYKSQAIYDKIYLIKCINYIHLNPVKSLIVKNCEDYKYSSYNYYANNINNKKDEKIKFIKKILENDNYMELLKNNQNNLNLFYDIDQNIEEIINDKIVLVLERKEKKIEEIYEDEQLLREIICELKKDTYKINNKDIMKKLKICKNKFYKLRD